MKLNRITWAAAIVILYIGSIVAFRNTHLEVWRTDGKQYLIFPKDQLWIYYFYRPITYVDSKLTTLQFHIGPH
ncbi:MAG: hypothetical protein HYZ44_10905 [Bacteroidetes bacterium]|nr:hypothetical protein [Bacteroidota bacterium]